MGHKGNSQAKQALEEDGEQNDWAAADPGEKQGRHNQCVERPHRDGTEPSRLYSDLYHPDKAQIRLWGTNEALYTHPVSLSLPLPVRPCPHRTRGLWSGSLLVTSGDKMLRVHSPDRLTPPAPVLGWLCTDPGQGVVAPHLSLRGPKIMDPRSSPAM